MSNKKDSPPHARRKSGPMEVVTDQRSDGSFELRVQERTTDEEAVISSSRDRPSGEIRATSGPHKVPPKNNPAAFVGLLVVLGILAAGAWVLFVSPGDNRSSSPSDSDHMNVPTVPIGRNIDNLGDGRDEMRRSLLHTREQHPNMRIGPSDDDSLRQVQPQEMMRAHMIQPEGRNSSDAGTTQDANSGWGDAAGEGDADNVANQTERPESIEISDQNPSQTAPSPPRIERSHAPDPNLGALPQAGDDTDNSDDDPDENPDESALSDDDELTETEDLDEELSEFESDEYLEDEDFEDDEFEDDDE